MRTHNASSAGRVACFIYGAVTYGLFVVVFAYAAGFVGNIVVPKSIDSGTPGPIGKAILINALLLGLFAVQHTIMARPWFKQRWTKIVPKPIERSTFVLATCLIFILMFWQWRPMPEVIWSVENRFGQYLLNGLFALGWVIVLYSSFCIDHFDLFGLRQVVLHLRGREYTHPGFATPWIYRFVRNPLMLGFLFAFWSTPVMTQGHLLFAVLTTGYILVGISFEERDIAAHLGDSYREYRARTPMLFPWPKRRSAARRAVAPGPVGPGE
jgi:protein-S-isoprenylcysteine O-methyltransferase Ste14